MVQVSSVETRYTEQGEGEPLVLIHGFPETLQGWRKNIPELSKHFRVIALDMVGFGGSEKTDWGFDCLRLAEFVKLFLEELGVKRAHIVGTDTGALIALAFAAQYPERVNKLVIFSGTAYADSISTADVKLMMMPVLGDGFFLLFGKPGLRLGIKKGFHRPEEVEKEIIDEYVNAFSSFKSRKLALKLMRTLGVGMEGVMEKLKQQSPPTLILWAEHEKYFYPWVAERFHADLKDSQLKYISDSGHFIQEEQPEIFNQTLLKFLSPGATHG